MLTTVLICTLVFIVGVVVGVKDSKRIFRFLNREWFEKKEIGGK